MSGFVIINFVLVHVFPALLYHGLPSAITTDQGKEFHNLLNSELMKVFGIKHRLTIAYHPQAILEIHSQCESSYWSFALGHNINCWMCRG